MQQGNVSQVMNDPLAQELLNSNIPARLAYAGRDGLPRAIPIGFLWDGTQFVMGTATNSPKVKVLQANPKVALTIDTNMFPPHVLLVRGTARVEADDRTFVLNLAPRLLIGMPSWRDPQLWLTAFQNWITASIEQHGQTAMVFVAEDDHGERLGFATLSHETHFTGERQAYINELANSEVAEGRGVGTALIAACEHWARNEGYRILALSTDAANARALGFYHHLGFRDEDVKLVKVLEEPGEVPTDRRT